MAKQLKKRNIELLEPILVRELGLERLYSENTNINALFQVEATLPAEDKKILHEARQTLIFNAEVWNEEELKMQFISIVMFLARFKSPLRTYYDREISAEIGDILIKCEADMVLSKGIGDLIETPYFFLHEYKREKRYSGDPVGQMLAGMLVAQAKNDNGKPIYGAYIQGRFWFFAVLEGKQYTLSESFDASKEFDCEKIVLILRNLQKIILEKLM